MLFRSYGNDPFPSTRSFNKVSFLFQVINSVAAEEVSNDEFKDLQIKIWEKLYSNLLQYQQVFNGQ